MTTTIARDSYMRRIFALHRPVDARVGALEVLVMDERWTQLSRQCRAVSALARAIAKAHEDLELIAHVDIQNDDVTGLRGRLTAERMKILGDMLNAMDAVSDEDRWMEEVFEAAQTMWKPAKQ